MCVCVCVFCVCVFVFLFLFLGGNPQHEQQVVACCQTLADYKDLKNAFKVGTENFG